MRGAPRSLRRSTLVGLLLWTAGLGACSGPPTRPDGGFVLRGSWDWLSSSGGIAGRTRTPDTEGFGQRLELDGNGELRLFRGDEVVVESSWRTTASPRAGVPTRIDFGRPYPFGFPFADASLTDGGRALELADPCCDGFVRSFVRDSSP